MGRSPVILIGALLAAAAVFAGAFFATRQVCANRMCNPADNLDWLRHEFKLSDTDMARVRQLHSGYMPKCGEMCARIDEKRQEVEAALTDATNFSAGAQQKLIELGELRARCQVQMLQHFFEVSQAMPPEQGRRYLAEMQRCTLGFHEQIEHSMTESSGHGNGEH